MMTTASPGLDLDHGFVHYIRQNQYCRMEKDQVREEGQTENAVIASSPEATTKRSRRPDQLQYTTPGRRRESSAMGKFGSLPALTISGKPLELSWEEIDIGAFVKESQPSIVDAVEDPTRLTSRYLSEVAYTIVNRAWEDPTYPSVAVRLCHYVTETERRAQQGEGSIPEYTFRRSVMEAIQLLLHDWEDMRRTDVHYWLGFAQFTAEAYHRIRVDGTTLRGLTDVLFGVVTHLSRPPCILNEEEVALLAHICLLCGGDLYQEDPQKVTVIVNSIRDAFLEPDTEQRLRPGLLAILEMQAARWTLTDDLRKVYQLQQPPWVVA